MQVNLDGLVKTIFSRKDAKDAKKLSFNIEPISKRPLLHNLCVMLKF